MKPFPPRLLFVVSIAVSLYWLAARFLNIYSSKLAGAMFEMLWLPMLLLLFLLPAVAAFFWIKSHFKLSSLYFFSLIISTATLVIIITKNN